MDYKTLGMLLAEHIMGIVILNEGEEILWSNGFIENICGSRNIVNRKFSNLLQVQLKDILDNYKTYKSSEENIYKLKASYIKEEKIYIIYIEELTDFNNKDVKIYCLEKIIESISDGVVLSDHYGKVVLYNKAQETLEELSSEEVVGKYLWEAYDYNPEYNPELAEHRRVYKTKEPIIERYKAHAYKNAIPKYVSYSTYPIIKDGEAIAVYSISKNETSLQSLLSETIELKRQLFSKGEKREQKYQHNGTTYTFVDIVGDSEVTKNVIKESQTVSLLSNTVLIVGETGTGKEVFAQSIHNFSKNKDEPFIAINCAAIPENLLESILFGTMKGAYTGAVTQSGLFEDAKGGTLFLDELNSMPISMQSKLLRVLQEKVVRRVGSSNVIPIQCRVISAINEDPQKLIEEERMRQDLFYRISGHCIYLPPLRERKEDIICIGEFFINKYNHMLNKSVVAFSKELREIMLNYNWPGNIRELEHFIENMMVRTRDNKTELTIDDIPRYIKDVILKGKTIKVSESQENTLPETLRTIERRLVIDGLNKNSWNLTKTAKDLGIIRQSLEYRIKKLNIERTIK